MWLGETYAPLEEIKALLVAVIRVNSTCSCSQGRRAKRRGDPHAPPPML